MHAQGRALMSFFGSSSSRAMSAEQICCATWEAQKTRPLHVRRRGASQPVTKARTTSVTTLPTKMMRLLSKCCIRSPIPTSPAACAIDPTALGPRRPGRVARVAAATAAGWPAAKPAKEAPAAVLHDGRHSDAAAGWPHPLRVRRRPTHGAQPSSAGVCVAMCDARENASGDAPRLCQRHQTPPPSPEAV